MVDPAFVLPMQVAHEFNKRNCTFFVDRIIDVISFRSVSIVSKEFAKKCMRYAAQALVVPDQPNTYPSSDIFTRQSTYSTVV